MVVVCITSRVIGSVSYATRIRLDHAVDILRAREGLEGVAARLAAERIDDDALAKPGALVERMECAVQDGDFDLYSTTNAKYHSLIYDASGSRQIPQLIQSLRARIARFQFRTVLVPGRVGRSFAEHRAIYEALKARDPDAAEQAMRTHIANRRQTLEEAWDLLKF